MGLKYWALRVATERTGDNKQSSKNIIVVGFPLMVFPSRLRRQCMVYSQLLI